MSGIVAWVDVRRDLMAEEVTLRSMTETLRRRGPSAQGVWLSRTAGLGHRGVRHLEPGAAAEPWVEEAGRVVVAHAGHIRNATELRGELQAHGYVFRTKSEAEVLAKAFLHWGPAFVERLDGALGSAVWDERERRLILVRDRLGVKPLYYWEYPGGILVASEPKGIMANGLFRARLEPSAIGVLLQPRLALAGETPLVGLRELPPAHWASYSPSGGLSSRRYWRLVSAPHLASFETTARTVRSLLEDIVRRDVPPEAEACGAMLSGGLDSTSVASLVTRELRRRGAARPLDTFCLRFEDDSSHFEPTELRPDVDAPFAAGAAAFLETRHSEISVSTKDLLGVVQATRSARDLPAWGQFDASMHLLFREMKRHCAVALTGEAADEIFGGYPYFFKSDVLHRKGFPWLGDGPRLADYLATTIKSLSDPRADEEARYQQLLAEVPRLPGEDPENARMREVFFLGLQGPLAVILDRKDRMSMAVGLEVRVPFCDHRLVEYVWNVPWSMKAQGGVKGLLKAAMADALPALTLNRKKSAYPHTQSPQYSRSLIDEATAIVGNERARVAELFDRRGLQRLIAELGAERDRGETRSFPGGASPAYMLVHIVELEKWLVDYDVAIG